MGMFVFKILDEKDTWRAVVCATPAEARAALGGFPDVMLSLASSAGPEYARLRATPGQVFTRAYDAYPRLWEPLLKAQEGAA